MAKKQIDATVAESKDDFTVSTGATVTGILRVAWDDSANPSDIISLLEKVRMRMMEDLADQNV